MKQVLSLLLLTLLALFARYTIPAVSAHPQDNSFLLLQVERDHQDKPLATNALMGYLQINAYDTAILLGMENSAQNTYQELENHREFLETYATESLHIFNNRQKCEVVPNLYSTTGEEVFYINGTQFYVTVTCSSEISQLFVNNSLFFEKQADAQNTVVVRQGESNIIATSLQSSPTQFLVISRKDGLLSATEQSLNRDTLESPLPTNKKFTFPDIDWASFTQKNNDALLFRVADLLKDRSVGAILLLLLIITIIGGLHSLEGGHNKIILATMMLKQEIDFKGSLLYVLIFTITHMSDIIILALGLLIFGEQINLYTRIPSLQTIAAYTLVGLSLFIVIKELLLLRKKRKQSSDKQNPPESKKDVTQFLKTDNIRTEFTPRKKKGLFTTIHKEQLMVAFVSGLAPCIMGWTIFVLIVSTGALWLLLPAVIAFGIGAFLVLLGFAYLVHLFKDKMITHVQGLSRWTSLISGVLLLLTSLIFLIF